MPPVKSSQQHPLLKKVIADDLCIACGACIYACPFEVIKPAYNEYRGAHEVEITKTDYCLGCASACEKVCPSIAVDFVEILYGGDRRLEVSREGPVERIYTGYSRKYRDNGVSSSGGIVRAIVDEAISKGYSVVCLGRRNGDYRAVEINEKEEMAQLPGSVYHSVSFVQALDIIRKARGLCVVVAIPCQLEGIVKYIAGMEPALENKIALKVGIICGWMFSDHALKNFLDAKGIAGKIIDAGYRGEDKVGRLKVATKEGCFEFSRREFRNPRELLDYRSSFSRVLNRLRCRQCQDHVNILADISVGDAWLKRKRNEKESIIVARTRQGQRFLGELEGKTDLQLEDGHPEDVTESQSSDLVFGVTAQEIAEMLGDKGYLRVSFNFGAKDQRRGQALPIRKRMALRHELMLRAMVREKRYFRFRMVFALRILRSLVRAFLAPVNLR